MATASTIVAVYNIVTSRVSLHTMLEFTMVGIRRVDNSVIKRFAHPGIIAARFLSSPRRCLYILQFFGDCGDINVQELGQEISNVGILTVADEWESVMR